jgi:tetratricopeptide (TPR) repeat protein
LIAYGKKLDDLDCAASDAFAANNGALYPEHLSQQIDKTSSSLITLDDTDSRYPDKIALKVTRDANGRLMSAYGVNPDDPYDAMLIERDYQGALEIAEQRLELDPHNPDFIFDKAFALELSGNHEEAFRHYRNVLALQSDNGAALNNAGNALAAMGRGDEAIVYYKQALSVDANDVTASLNLAEEYRAQGNLQMYYNQIDPTLKMSPSSAEGQLYLTELQDEQAARVQNDLHVGVPDGYRPH